VLHRSLLILMGRLEVLGLAFYARAASKTLF